MTTYSTDNIEIRLTYPELGTVTMPREQLQRMTDINSIPGGLGSFSEGPALDAAVSYMLASNQHRMDLPWGPTLELPPFATGRFD